MLFLDRDDIKNVFDMRDAIEADKIAYSVFSDGKGESPLRINFESKSEKGNILFMPGYVGDLGVAGLKAVSVFPNNDKHGLPSISGTVMLVDDKTGILKAILDGTYVTELRTGASTGAAISLFGRKGSKIACLFGTGGQAESQFDAILSACDTIEEIRVYSRNKNNRVKFVDKMIKKYGTDLIKIVAVSDRESALDGADIIVLATTSEVPVIDGDLIKKGALISGIGSYTPAMHEIDEKTLLKADKIYFDSKDAVLSEAGCFITPLKNGIISEDRFTGDIGDFINGKLIGRENDDEIIVFKSVGISVQDLVTGELIYKRAVEKGVGKQV
ncbi:ornithine cyclodeaminase family protein [Peptostreptococcus sp. D1]|uniref:ornithine cyclodeaminase family protein n=1 Tax=Peptostreptococcus sp. D1 TaxID=72304 RepID=UPI0008DF79D5|nr:ornithine cyclodeaminase family protein [Peptostreptococcus sp. D1]SFE49892.1 ornithine cyclodeaminase [Peptostreptococcus sp. D1]